MSRASLVFEQSIIRPADNGSEEILTRGEVKIVSLSLHKKRPVALLEMIYNKFK